MTLPEGRRPMGRAEMAALTRRLADTAICELREVTQCRCRPAYKDCGLRDPACECDSGGAVTIVADRIEELEAKLAKAVEALETIAKPKVGPDFDWTEDEVNRWRAVWYRKHEDIARAALACIRGDQSDG